MAATEAEESSKRPRIKAATPDPQAPPKAPSCASCGVSSSEEEEEDAKDAKDAKDDAIEVKDAETLWKVNIEAVYRRKNP